MSWNYSMIKKILLPSEKSSLRKPQEISANIAELNAEAAQVLDNIRGMV